MSYTFQNRKVEVTDLEFEHGEGAFATSAIFEDTGVELTDDELEDFNELCAHALYDAGYQRLVMRAEAHSDSLEDR